MVLNGILVFFLGLTAFLFLQYDTFYTRQNPKPLARLLREESLEAGLAALRGLPPIGAASSDLDPRSFFSFLQSGPPADTALFAVFQSQFEGKETIRQALLRFESLEVRDQVQSVRLAFLVADRAQFAVAYPTLTLLISDRLVHDSESQIIDLILALKTQSLQKLMVEKYLSVADDTQSNRLMARIESSSLNDDTKSSLKKVFNIKKGTTE